MREIKLTKGYVALVDDEDFARVNQWKWQAHVLTRKDESVLAVYARRYILGTGKAGAAKQYLHRFILGTTDPKERVDHKDHNGLNCRRYNLRDSQGRNNQNQRLKPSNTSGFKGRVGGHYRFFGYFSDPLEAACAYDMAAVKHYGEFACCNFAIPY
jgi:hypothetical protein